jgi:protein gp37
MGKETAIEWCDSTLNLMMGCDGCELWNPKAGIKKCYAGQLTERYAGFSSGYPAKFEEPRLYPNRVADAMKWSDLTGTDRPDRPWLNGLPRTIFLDDMGDTFSKSLATNWLETEKFKSLTLMEAMACTSHLYLLLTKRPERMAEMFSGKTIKNFWLGTSLTSKLTLPRLKSLQSIIGNYVRFLSCEPLVEDLGELDLSGIHWVIVGGESGPGARPMEIEWAENIRLQCVAQGVKFFMKQLGGVRDKRGDLAQMPENLRVREYPNPSAGRGR